MLHDVSLDNVLFLDIETVPQYPEYSQMPEDLKKYWDKKATQLVAGKEELSPEEIYTRAGIYAEFGKIICIGVGFLVSTGQSSYSARLKMFAGDDEKTVLTEFSTLLKTKYFGTRDLAFCAHNGKEFDYPYIARRMIINGLPLPAKLDFAGKKPWEIKHLDTMELWKFGDYKNYVSLGLLASVLGIPTPKDDIDGSMVGQVYWTEKNLKRIEDYCVKDVLTVMQVFMRYKGMPLLSDNDWTVSE